MMRFYVPMQNPITYPDPCTGNLFDMTHARPGTGFLHADRPAIMKGLNTVRWLMYSCCMLPQ
ncbi:hypothetical protein BO85DRAFT_53180 [Aspergillus piperis CBS 112811]|uniref:Uncharacterized protein n=1 Tax=Aspergillus piperis CBS 112811 TaxID=1448313 RepID=A0A8G1VNB6_9EURO|nr:hypothetical protein BO85DRAFT_53180 [Aspergillus piperis CBS 112811]RAH56543.1 hypothetical protein BO85DRAFT_53180 [Aspergillus piperis CBS 112811]